MRAPLQAGSIDSMLDPDEIVDADDELSEDDRDDELLTALDPVDLVEAHLAGVPFN
jgi:hypothetical protein